MTKLMTAAAVAVLSLSLTALGYAGQGKTDTGGASGQVSPSTPDASSPSMGSDPGSQGDKDKSATQSQKKRKQAGRASGESMDPKNDSKSKTPPMGGEGSNPTLDSTGKGGTSGG